MLSNRPKVRAAGTWRLAVIPRHAHATPRPRLEPRTTPPLELLRSRPSPRTTPHAGPGALRPRTSGSGSVRCSGGFKPRAEALWFAALLALSLRSFPGAFPAPLAWGPCPPAGLACLLPPPQRHQLLSHQRRVCLRSPPGRVPCSPNETAIGPF